MSKLIILENYLSDRLATYPEKTFDFGIAPGPYDDKLTELIEYEKSITFGPLGTPAKDCQEYRVFVYENAIRRFLRQFVNIRFENGRYSISENKTHLTTCDNIVPWSKPGDLKFFNAEELRSISDPLFVSFDPRSRKYNLNGPRNCLSLKYGDIIPGSEIDDLKFSTRVMVNVSALISSLNSP